MKELLVGLMFCLLASLLVVETDGVQGEHSPLLTSLVQHSSLLPEGAWAILSTWSERATCFRVPSDEAGWQFLLEKWGGGTRTASSGGSGWTAAEDLSSKRARPTSVSEGC